MWRNDTKCKYIFMFPLKNLTRKWLTIVICVFYIPPIHLIFRIRVWIEIFCEYVAWKTTVQRNVSCAWCTKRNVKDIDMPFIMSCVELNGLSKAICNTSSRPISHSLKAESQASSQSGVKLAMKLNTSQNIKFVMKLSPIVWKIYMLI